MKSIGFENVIVHDQLWAERIGTVISKTIPDIVEKCYTTGRIENFLVAAGKSTAPHTGKVYNDSDVYKLMEGMSYALINAKGEDYNWIKKELAKLVTYVADAQEGNGYINTKFTSENNGRWEDMDAHEMYNGGHLIEAGCAYYMATDSKDLLNVGIKFADHIIEKFVDGGDKWVPGHQEIELALERLATVTNEEKYMKAAYYLLEQRGHGIGASERNFNSKKWLEFGEEYYMDKMPIKDLDHIMGHAVRGLYMMTGMNNIRYDGVNYDDAVIKMWRNIIDKNMYITGGVGSSRENEGFNGDYLLPNATAYCETCASVAMSVLAKGINERYSDLESLEIIDLILHNSGLSGLSLSGTEFFYDNPLESEKNHQRSEWFKTSCCPTQLARFIPQIGGFIYAEKDEKYYINQLISSKFRDEIKLDVDYIKGTINIDVLTENEVYIRIPKYIMVTSSTNDIVDGYIKLEEGENKIEFNTQINFHRANSKINEDVGKVAVSYGPFILCLESDTPIEIGLSGQTAKRVIFDEINGFKYPSIIIENQKLIPYFMWNNNGPKNMKVWFKDKEINKLYN